MEKEMRNGRELRDRGDKRGGGRRRDKEKEGREVKEEDMG